MAKLAYWWEGGGAGRTFPDWLVHIGLKNGSSLAKSRPPSIMQLQYPCLHDNWATHWRLHYSWRIPPVAPRLYYICPIGRLAGAARRGLLNKNAASGGTEAFHFFFAAQRQRRRLIYWFQPLLKQVISFRDVGPVLERDQLHRHKTVIYDGGVRVQRGRQIKDSRHSKSYEDKCDQAAADLYMKPRQSEMGNMDSEHHFSNMKRSRRRSSKCVEDFRTTDITKWKQCKQIMLLFFSINDK